MLWNVAGIFSICCSSATIAIWWWQKFLKMQYNWCEYLVVSFLLIVVSCMCMVYWTSYLGSRHQPSNSRNRFLSSFFCEFANWCTRCKSVVHLYGMETSCYSKLKWKNRQYHWCDILTSPHLANDYFKFNQVVLQLFMLLEAHSLKYGFNELKYFW